MSHIDPTASRRPSSTHRGGRQDLPGQGGAHHRLNDLDQEGPVCSASPGRRLTGWRHPSQRPETPAGGVMPPSKLTQQSPGSLLASDGPGFCHVSRHPAGWNRRRREAEASAAGRRPGLIRRRERPVRAALTPYRSRVVPHPDQHLVGRSDRGAVRATADIHDGQLRLPQPRGAGPRPAGVPALRNANARHPDVITAQRRERARVRSERRQRWGRPHAQAA